MMKSLLSLSLLLGLTLTLYAQQGTTEDEYRYLSRGYGYQVEMGLDPEKEGYRIEEVYRSPEGNPIMALKRASTDEMRGMLLVLPQETYVALPRPDSPESTWELFRKDKLGLPTEAVQLYELVLYEYLYEGLSELKLQKAASKSGRMIKSADPVSEPELAASLQPAGEGEDAGGRKVEQMVGGELMKRKVKEHPVLKNQSIHKGTVVIKICVGPTGKVTDARYTQRGSTTTDHNLIELAENTALKYLFDFSPLKEQCGTLTFVFN